MFNANSTPIQCPIRDSAAKIRVDQSFAAKYSGMSCLTKFWYVLFEQSENENAIGSHLRDIRIHIALFSVDRYDLVIKSELPCVVRRRATWVRFPQEAEILHSYLASLRGTVAILRGTKHG